ncbi:unnamed protein product [Rangifer tarandus platyrhynchus]|uniref:Uncharacterized protein n=1 Tax=Rangifer tarandus platyrhynchus TaxID=3082113 RepID=A0ABN8ZQP6_RANTA|nr:unnamed protein product [Rangifer tarandus platyrhynchus]
MQGKGSHDCTCCVPVVSLASLSTVRRWRSCSCCWYSFPLSLPALPLLSVISLLGHFLTINLVFAFLELLPAASFGIHNAHQSVADHTLFVSVIFMQYFFLSSIFNL